MLKNGKQPVIVVLTKKEKQVREYVLEKLYKKIKELENYINEKHPGIGPPFKYMITG